MRKRPAKKAQQHTPAKAPLPPPVEEWDFRAITEPYLEFAIFYEYAREAPWIVQAFQRWHESLLSLPEGSAAAETWNGRTIKDALEIAEGALPADIIFAVEDSLEDGYTGFPFAQIRAISRLFPQPWLKVAVPPLEVLQETCLLSRTFPSFQILSDDMSPSDWCETDPARDLAVEPFLGTINWRHSNEAILAAAKSEVERKRKEFCDSFPDGFDAPPRGKAAESPLHMLKELAAYRLRKAGFSYAKAQSFIRSYHDQNRTLPGDTLPAYESGGGWSDAIAKAKARIEMLEDREDNGG